MSGLGGFYAGKTVLLTGHTGFKGGWLACWLKRLGANVIGYALPPEPGPSLFADARVADDMTSLRGDVRDLAALEAAYRTHRPDLVFHLAAQPLVLRSYREPLETLAANVQGTANVLDCARRAPSVRAVLVVTSDKCYAHPDAARAHREDDPMGGADPYSASKGCAELVASAWRASFFSGDRAAGIATARAGNVVGGGDWAADRIVPDCVRALRAGRAVTLRRPQAVRPWQHVLEPLSGYLWLGRRLAEEPGRHAGGWNFGPADDAMVPVEELARLIVKAWGSGAVRAEQDPSAPPETATLRLDCGKALRELGWRGVWSVEECVQETVSWYRAHGAAHFDAAAAVASSIERYEARAAAADLPWARAEAKASHG